MQKVNDCSVTTVVDNGCGIARCVLSLHCLTGGEIFRVKNTTTNEWEEPPVFSINAAIKPTEKDLMNVAKELEELVEKAMAAILDREDSILFYLLSRLKTEENTTKGITWSNLEKLPVQVKQLVVNFDFVSRMDEEIKTHFEPEAHQEILGLGRIGRIKIGERIVPVWQSVAAETSVWIAACPAPQDLGAMAVYDTKITPITARDGQIIYQEQDHCVILFEKGLQFIEE